MRPPKVYTVPNEWDTKRLLKVKHKRSSKARGYAALESIKARLENK